MKGYGVVEVVLGVALAMILAISAGANGITTSTTWAAQVVRSEVPLGQPINLMVYGPPNGLFKIQVFEQPYNSTPPVENFTYEMPNATNLTGYSVLNASVSTQLLNLGPVQVRASNDSVGVFEISNVLIEFPVNATALVAVVSQIWGQLNVTDARETSLLYEQGLDRQHWDSEWQTMLLVNGLGWATIMFVVVFWASPVRETKAGIAVRRAFRAVGYKDTYVGPYPGTEPPQEPRVVDPTRVCVSRMFPSCSVCQVPKPEAEHVGHLRFAHSITEPRIGTHYEYDWREIRRQISVRPVSRPNIHSVIRAASEDAVDSGFD